ncbi:hypothetical protein TNCV_5037711 [Trichonephila clavipes]|nr:hypothetical protein TNCV_5037711 [Trichonephila clavipes]
MERIYPFHLWPTQRKRMCGSSVVRGRYPTRWQPNRQVFTRVPQNLAEHGFFRATIDDTLVNFEMGLVAKIPIAAATISEMPGIFKHVRQSMSCPYHACIHANFSKFKHLL